MRLVKVGAAVLNQTPLDWDGNTARIRDALRAAKAEHVSILCLPELCVTGYGCEDTFHAPGVLSTAEEILLELLPETRGMVVGLGLPLMYRNSVFNAAALVVDGAVAGFVGKQYLAADGIHYEPRWFKPWTAGAVGHVEFGGRRLPFGDVRFDVGGVQMAFEICEDAWVATRPGARHAADGVDVMLNPSASHFSFGKIATRERFVIEGSRAFGVSYIYTNLVGNEAGRAIYDGGALIASGGELMARGPRFGYADVGLTSATVDITLSRTRVARTGSFRPDLTDDDGGVVEVPFAWPEPPPEAPARPLAAWETGAHVKEEEFTRAESLALFDYLRKSYSRGFVVSISGGADSAACAVLVAQMVRLAWADLGRQRFLAKLAHVPDIQSCTTPQAVTEQILTCVYQGTRNSSETTRAAAEAVARGAHGRYLEFDVDHLVESYTTMVAEGLGETLSWDKHDVALQNIQARARAPGVWMLANLANALLLSTSNRSEAAVGYATMDGDTCGGLSPLAGIDKDYLRRWLRWVEAVGPEGVGPVPALRAVNVQQPTAELRPSEENQTDEGDLMPYDLLDAIEGAAIRDKLMPQDVYRVMRRRYPAHDGAQLKVWITRFFRYWSRNQWKRERYAPSFHLDDLNLDPRSWCRFPILSGGFARELRELEAME